MKVLLLLVLTFGLAKAGFRCTFGDGGCTAGCVVLGQTSGMCDDENDCWCSEKRIDLDAFKAILPSRCDLDLKFCQGTCHAIGRRDGFCEQRRGDAKKVHKISLNLNIFQRMYNLITLFRDVTVLARD